MPTSDYAPSTQEVARLAKTRTKDTFGNYVTSDDGNGNQVPDFSDATVPTKSEVSGLIVDALDEVSDTIGSDIPADSFVAARRIVSYLVAANIELSYKPDQAGQRDSTYDKLLARYSTLLASFQEDIAGEVEEEEAQSELPLVEGGVPTGWDTVSW